VWKIGGTCRPVQAAEALSKTQSSVTYAVQQIESALGVKAFEIKGRKAALTSTGQFLYRRGRTLLEEAGALEHAARKLSAGWEAELGLAIEILFPTWLLLDCLQRFGQVHGSVPHAGWVAERGDDDIVLLDSGGEACSCAGAKTRRV